MAKLSLKDIAQHFNISTATVSYILNGKSVEKRVSLQLTESVMEFVKKHDYKPNMLAKGLRTGKTNVICLMVEEIADHFFSAVAGHIETLAYEKGYKIIYCSTKNDAARAKDLIKTFEQQNVDGFIIVPPTGIEEEIRGLIKSSTPFVLFDRYYTKVKTSYVGMDNYESSVKAVEHLFSQGYENIAFVTLDSEQTQMRERLVGYESTMMKHQKTPIVKSVQYSKAMQSNIVDEMAQFIQSFPQLDAIFFATNYLAIHGLKALDKLHKKIPTDIGVLAFDDHALFEVYKPTITAVTQPIHEMCIQLMSDLLEKMVDKSTELNNVIIPATLSVRQSSVKLQ